MTPGLPLPHLVAPRNLVEFSSSEPSLGEAHHSLYIPNSTFIFSRRHLVPSRGSYSQFQGLPQSIPETPTAYPGATTPCFRGTNRLFHGNKQPSPVDTQPICGELQLTPAAHTAYSRGTHSLLQGYPQPIAGEPTVYSRLKKTAYFRGTHSLFWDGQVGDGCPKQFTRWCSNLL